MLKRLLIVTFCILSLPALASLSHSNGSSNPASYPVIAFAGHATSGGGYCSPCGCPGSGCACDPGEQSGQCGNQATTPSDDKRSDSGTPSSGFDYGTGAMLLALALFVWLRLRA